MILLSRLSRVVKFTLAQALYYTGILNALLSWRLRRSAVVLMYHRVLPKGADSWSSPAIVVTPETFARHMRIVRHKLRVLEPASFAAAVTSGQVPPKGCLVTFDDGWFDNHRHALPILARERVPALVFVATGYIGGDGCFWQERMSRLLATAWRAGDRATSALEANGVPSLAGLDATAARHFIGATIMRQKNLPLAALRDWMRSLTQALAALGITVDDPGDDRFMNWDEVTGLARSGVVTIGSHARSHLPLEKLDAETRRDELAASRREIETRLGAEVRMLAYPNGGHDDATVADARAAGYSLAFTTERGNVRPGDAPLRLRRINVAEHGTTTPAEFLCRVAGIL